MAFLQLGMVLAAIAGAFVAGGAFDQGFPVEVAIVRGTVAFMAVSFAGYVAELVVVTAPRHVRARREPRRAQREHEAQVEDTNARPAAAPPQLMAPTQRADESVNENEDDAGLRPAA